jgi:putative membrane protein
MKIPSILLAVLALAAAPAAAQAPSDPEIAHIVVTANQVDIDAGKIAQKRATNAEVKAFAARMVADHEGVNTSAVALAKKLNVTPEDNATSKSLDAGGDKHLARLKTLKGAAFDQAYIDREVAYHQQVLDAMDKVLIPNARNEELRALLVKVRPAFVAHLEHAKQIQSSLTKGS